MYIWKTSMIVMKNHIILTYIEYSEGSLHVELNFSTPCKDLYMTDPKLQSVRKPLLIYTLGHQYQSQPKVNQNSIKII